MSERTDAKSIREICRLLFRHKKKAAFLSLAILGLTAAVVIFYPRTYISEAKLFVRVGRESIGLDPTATQGQTTHVQKSYEHEINSVLEILNSRAIAERVAKSIGVEKILGSGKPNNAFQTLLSNIKRPVQQLDPISDEERAIIVVQKSTSFEAPKDSGVIRVTCKANSPEMAQRVVAETVETFRAEHIRVSRTRGSHLFFSQQAEQQRERLEIASRELRDAKNKDGVVTVDGKRALLLNQIGQIETDAIATINDLAYAEARSSDLQKSVDNLPETIVKSVESGIGHRSTDAMRQQLYSLEIQERHHSARYTKDHPALLAVKSQREKVEDIFASQPGQRSHTTQGLNESRVQLRVQLLAEHATVSALRAKSKSLTEEHARLDRELENMNDREIHLAHLQRQVDLAENNYQKYLNNLEQARIDQALQSERISSINTIQPASYSELPASPRKTLVVALGLFLATFCPLALAFAAEHFDHSFSTPTQVEQELGLPVLASIPRTSSRRLILN